MLARSLVSHILHDEALTRHLHDPEARLLVEWLVERVEDVTHGDRTASEEAMGIERLCRRARSIGRFVSLWCHQRLRASALQLVATERFDWPLPTCGIDPFELMQSILVWEDHRIGR